MGQPSRAERYGSLMVDIITILTIMILLLNSVSYPVKFIAIIIPVIYFPVLHSLLSRSIGDMVFRLKIVDRQGNKIGFRLALNRFLCVFKYSIVSALFTNLLFIIFFFSSGRDIKEVSFDYEGESGTYLVKAKPD